MGCPFRIITQTCVEKLSLDLSPIEQTLQLARGKAQSVATQLPQDLGIGNDEKLSANRKDFRYWICGGLAPADEALLLKHKDTRYNWIPPFVGMLVKPTHHGTIKAAPFQEPPLGTPEMFIETHINFINFSLASSITSAVISD